MEKGRGDMEVRGEREREIIYLSLYAVTTRMTSALRWAAVRAILIFR